MNTSGPIAWMAKNPVAANLAMVVILVAGALGMTRIEQEVFPEFVLDMVTVSVVYPGASPSEVEQGIVLAIEEQVRGVTGIKRVSSTATEGVAAVIAELLLDANPDQVLADIKSSVDRIKSFPEDSEEPKISMFTAPKGVISVMLYGDLSLSTLHQLAERLRGRLVASGDVTKVEIEGVPPREVAIEVPRETLESLGVTLDQLALQVRAASTELPGGEVETAGGEILIRLADRRRSTASLEDIIIRGTPTGGQVRLGDVAQITDGYADFDQRTLYDGQPAVRLKAYRVGSETPRQVASTVRETAKRFHGELSKEVGLAFWHDESQMLDGRIDLLVRNGRLGLILVVLILAMFLNARLAFWVSMGIPISFMGSFLLMPGIGVTINMISLFSLIVTLGMVVDDAIVVGEAAYERMERGQEKLTAAIDGAREMAVPVTFAILTTIAAFAPLFFVPGFMGKIFRIMPAVIISVLLFSLFESFFVLPAHLAHLGEKGARGRMARVFDAIETQLDKPRTRVSGWLARFTKDTYAPFLERVVRNRYTAAATAIFVLLITVGLVGGRVIPTGFMPDIEGYLVSCSARLPYGAPTEQTERVRVELEASLAEVIDALGPETVRGVYTTVGSPPVVEMGPGFDRVMTGSHLLGIQVYLVESSDRDFSSEDFAKAWSDKTPALPGVDALAFTGNFGPGGGKAIELRLSHPDAAILTAATQDTLGRLHQYKQLTDIETTEAAGKPRLDFHLRASARSLGITALDLGRQIRSSFFGAEALREQRGRDEVRVMLRLPKEQRSSEFDLDALRLRTPSGASVPLAQLASFERTRAPAAIQREDGKRTANISAALAPDVPSAQEVLSAFTSTDLPELTALYPGLDIGYSGRQREEKESFAALGKNFLIALFVIYSLLAVPFRSYIQPVIIMSAIPFGIVGAIFGHLFMGLNLSIISMFGIIALSGVVVNDSLVLIHAANRYRTEGDSPYDAIVRAGQRRMRPILLTSLTTFFGLAPMIFETELQAQFLIPMGVSLGFGVLFATFIVLLLVPAVYMIVEDVRDRAAGTGHKKTGESAGEAI